MKSMFLKLPANDPKETAVWALEFSSQALSTQEVIDRSEKILGLTLWPEARQAIADMVQDSASTPGSRRSLQWRQPFSLHNSVLTHNDCFDWLNMQEDNAFHAVVTDPPYGLAEYSEKEQQKLRSGRGGVWRLPPTFDGSQRSPLPRFTTLTEDQLQHLHDYFFIWGRYLYPKLRPGGLVLIASNPLLSHLVTVALTNAGLESRGQIVRLVTTLRGGDRPKGAHEEFREVTVMPRSNWEPWIVLRRPLHGRVQDSLREWGTGGFRRPTEDNPFSDVIQSGRTSKREKAIAPHPSLKPQDFLRKVVRGVLPLGEGLIADPFAGAGATLAAAEAVGYRAVGVERDPYYFDIATKAIAALAAIETKTN